MFTLVRMTMLNVQFLARNIKVYLKNTSYVVNHTVPENSSVFEDSDGPVEITKGKHMPLGVVVCETKWDHSQ